MPQKEHIFILKFKFPISNNISKNNTMNGFYLFFCQKNDNLSFEFNIICGDIEKDHNGFQYIYLFT